MKPMNEYNLSCWFHLFLTAKGIKHNASMSGGVNLGPRIGAIKKRMGASAGYPDFDIPYKRGPYSGLRIELKIKGGVVTDEQIAWRDHLLSEGYLALIMPCNLDYRQAQDYLELAVENYMGLSQLTKGEG